MEAQQETQRLEADFEVLGVIAAPRELCGAQAVYATLRVRVIAVRDGQHEPSEMRVAWLSRGTPRETLEEALVGRRYRARLRRWIHSRERDFPLERPPAFFVRGTPRSLE